MDATRTSPALIRDVMTTEIVCATPSMTIRELARLFEVHDISGAPVITDDGDLVGVVSKSDLIRQALHGSMESAPHYFFESLSEQLGEDTELDPESTVVVEDIMSEDVVTSEVDDRVSDIARLMAESGVHRVIVVDPDGAPMGIVTSLDILRAYPDC